MEIINNQVFFIRMFKHVYSYMSEQINNFLKPFS